MMLKIISLNEIRMKFPTVVGCLCRAGRYKITEPPTLSN
jgi:hypothetical protein